MTNRIVAFAIAAPASACAAFLISSVLRDEGVTRGALCPVIFWSSLIFFTIYVVISGEGFDDED